MFDKVDVFVTIFALIGIAYMVYNALREMKEMKND